MNISFEVPFIGLKQGTHQFKFEVGNSFFDSFPHSLVQEGNLIAELSLDKKETIMIANFFIKGNVKTNCSSCNEMLCLELEDKMINYYKFGTEKEEDENLFVLSPDEYKINVAQQIYELITVAIPPGPKHEKGECNEEMVKLIRSYQGKDSKKVNTDPRWEKLNKLN
jgi:uncharacterized metal-binding protein YceD (DUF177 family)